MTVTTAAAWYAELLAQPPGPAQAHLLQLLDGYLRLDAPDSVAGVDQRGRLAAPDPLLVLEHLAHSQDLLPDPLPLWLGGVGAVTVVDELPPCDRCGVAAARYDVPGTRGERGAVLPAWYACPSCWPAAGRTRLGYAESTYLLTPAEIPRQMRQLCNAVRAELGKGSALDDLPVT